MQYNLIRSFSGMQTIKVVYKDITSVDLLKGYLEIFDGTCNSFCVLDDTINLICSSTSPSTQYAIYVKKPLNINILSGSDITYSSTMPIESIEGMGWYHPTNVGWRCIGFIQTTTGNTIHEFYITKTEWRLYTEYEFLGQVDGNVNTSLDGTVPIPISDVVSILKVYVTRYNSYNHGPYIKRKDESYMAVNLGQFDGTCARFVVPIYLKCDSLKRFTLSSSPLYRYSASVCFQGFVLPDYIYN